MELPPSITGHLNVTESGCYPDWQAVGSAIEESFPESQHDAAWDAICLAWVHGICRQLGEGYRVLETQNFLIVSAADQPSVELTGQDFEKVRRKILNRLTDLIAGPVKGKQVALILASEEQYYQYIAHFFPDGEHPMNGGMCLRGRTYLHLAFPSTEASADLRTLAHEMTHGLLGHLPLPNWLDEALAMRMEQLVCGADGMLLDREQYNRHLDYWNEATIQEFWSGAAWQIPGDGFELSYDLARVLWFKIEADLAANPQKLIQFITSASFEDAGDSAFRAAFGSGLGELVASFLGKGSWSPAPDTWGIPGGSGSAFLPTQPRHP